MGGESELSDRELDLYGYVSSSKRRVAVMTVLEDDPMTPRQIADSTDIRINHVSNVLSELSDNSLAECVNPDRKRGRVYRLTATGHRVATKVTIHE